MADVADDRGQLLLVTGLLVATGIVVLVLLLNSAIYSQHMATRGLEADDRAPVEYRRTVVETVGGILVRENRAGHDTRANIEENITADIRWTATLLRRDTASRGAWANTSDPTYFEGMLLRQNDTDRELTSASGASNWTLARDMEATRRFRMNVSGGLTSTEDLLGNAYGVSLTGTNGNTWRLHVYRNASGATVVSVKNGSEASADEVCSSLVSSKPALDITAGTIDGQPCSAIQFGKGITAPYELAYVNGHSAAGNYTLVVDTTGGATVETSNFNTTGGAAPTYTPSVYGVKLVVEYDGPGLRYRTQIRVAPGDDDG